MDTGYAHATWTAWSTYVFLGVSEAPALTAARDLTERLMAELDMAISRFRDDSDLMLANARSGRWTDVGDWLVEATAIALAAARDSGGLVDPTLGRHLAALGYDDDLDAVRGRGDAPPRDPDPADLPALPPPTAAWRRVRTEPGRVLVPAGSALDLGATGKAFAADRIAAAVADRVGTDCILSLGGDVATAARPGSTAEHPWRIAVSERPREPVCQVITVPRGGVATSTVMHRTWTRDGRTLHHLLDPATGLPVRRTWRTATVRAQTCVAANTASTAALVLGEGAEDWLTARALDARLVDRRGSVVTVGDWPEDVPATSPNRAEEVA